MKRCAILLLLLLAAIPAQAQVAFDAEAHGSTASSTTSIPNFTLTIGGGVTNGAVYVGIGWAVSTITSVTITVGGSTPTLVSGTDSSTPNDARSMIYCIATGSSTGAKTVSISWTGATNAAAVAISASGVDQTTPCNGGTFTVRNNTSATTNTVTITSATNDMTYDFLVTISGNTPTSPTQTSRAAFQSSDFQLGAGASTAAGAASVVHTWTVSTFSSDAHSGANFKAVASGTNKQLKMSGAVKITGAVRKP